LKQLAWVILLSQGFLALQFNLWYLGGYNILRLEGFGGMDNNCNAIALVTCLGLAFFLALESPKWWQKAVAMSAAALMAHAIMFSFSRGGMLALMITGLVTFLIIPKRPIHYLGFAVAALFVIRFAGPQVMERFQTTFASAEKRDASADSRVELWKACLDSIRKRPWGVGPANWGEVVTEYGFVKGKLAHSLWLQLAAELGVLGVLLLVLFYGGCMWRLWPLARNRSTIRDPWFGHLARMVIASLIGFVVAAQFVSLDLLEQPYYITLIGAGLLKISSTGNTPRPPWATRRDLAGLGLPAPMRQPSLTAS
jgi:O-antigen ligase